MNIALHSDEANVGSTSLLNLYESGNQRKVGCRPVDVSHKGRVMHIEIFG